MRKFITYADRILPVHHPRVVVETAARLGVPREAVLEGTELTLPMLDSPDMRVSYLEYAAISVNALRLTKNPGLGLLVGRNTGIAQMGVLGFLLPCSPTLGAALEAALHYGSGLAPVFDLRLERHGATCTLVFAEALPLFGLRLFSTEVALASFGVHARLLGEGSHVRFSRVELPFAEPPHAHLYEETFEGALIAYERPAAAVEFDSRLLDAKIPFADPAAFKLAEELCARILAPESVQEGLLAQMRRLIATEPAEPPSLSQIAQVLRTSARTLRRELHRMETSYKALVDEVRRTTADEWLRSNTMPVELLAQRLGFSTVGSFRRAYKRWTGLTPSAARLA